LKKIGNCLEAFICVIAEAAKELHDKLLKSVVDQRTAPPNNWLWSLIEKCENREDIKLLFNVLENLRKFVSYLILFPNLYSLSYNHLILFLCLLQRLSNLRIFENFNDNLCREVSKACVRVEAIDLGMKYIPLVPLVLLRPFDIFF
jgi:hypothetical protein